MQYKVSFFLTAFGQFLISFSAILGVYFLLDRFHAIKGYTFTDILLCSSVIIMAFSLAECFARGFDQFPKAISNGEFDRMLVRPAKRHLSNSCFKAGAIAHWPHAASHFNDACCLCEKRYSLEPFQGADDIAHDCRRHGCFFPACFFYMPPSAFLRWRGWNL